MIILEIYYLIFIKFSYKIYLFMSHEPIIKYEEISANFGDEMVTYMIESFEKMTFNEKMSNLLSGMIERDWVKAMIAAHTMKGSSGY